MSLLPGSAGEPSDARVLPPFLISPAGIDFVARMGFDLDEGVVWCKMLCTCSAFTRSALTCRSFYPDPTPIGEFFKRRELARRDYTRRGVLHLYALPCLSFPPCHTPTD